MRAPNLEASIKSNKARNKFVSKNAIDKIIATHNSIESNPEATYLNAANHKKNVIVLNPGKINFMKCIEHKNNKLCIFPNGWKVITVFESNTFIIEVGYSDKGKRWFTAQTIDEEGNVSEPSEKTDSAIDAIRKVVDSVKSKLGPVVAGLGASCENTNKKLVDFFIKHQDLITANIRENIIAILNTHAEEINAAAPDLDELDELDDLADLATAPDLADFATAPDLADLATASDLADFATDPDLADLAAAPAANTNDQSNDSSKRHKNCDSDITATSNAVTYHYNCFSSLRKLYENNNHKDASAQTDVTPAQQKPYHMNPWN